MKAMVTGANGFIGANVVLALLRENIEVRAFVRKQSDTRALAGLDVELVQGDLRDPASVRTAVRGCHALFHTAALYTLWTRTPEEVYATNVAGTETVMKAALEQGIEKIVYTSSESTVACAGDAAVATETGYTDPNRAARRLQAFQMPGRAARPEAVSSGTAGGDRQSHHPAGTP